MPVNNLTGIFKKVIKRKNWAACAGVEPDSLAESTGFAIPPLIMLRCIFPNDTFEWSYKEAGSGKKKD